MVAIADSSPAGFEITMRVGPSLMQDSITGFPNQNRIPYKFEFDAGIASGLEVGYRINPHWRIDVELARRDNDLSKTSTPGSAGGHLAVTALMANVYFDVLAEGNWTPYFGGGSGYAWTDFDNISINGNTLINDTEHAAAFQGFVGALYRINQHWSASLDYRYLATTDPLVKNTSGEIMEPSIRNHVVTIGLTRSFDRLSGGGFQVK
jgi:opacity protein-like surface antigen